MEDVQVESIVRAVWVVDDAGWEQEAEQHVVLRGRGKHYGGADQLRLPCELHGARAVCRLCWDVHVCRNPCGTCEMV